MKKAVLVIGSIFFLYGLFNSIKYALDYSELAAYGKGYVWGNAFLMVLGLLLVFFVFRRSAAR
ncbi:MAG TPA: hypothetical protein VKZ51_12015 [Cyclobacteriaceae bacterium]|nr:hypothetical protein [Cyclobacteriaceae bacterium]